MCTTKVKRILSTQVTEDSEIDITNWLGYEVTQIGACGCRIGANKKTAYPEDNVCVPSDGIPFVTDSTLVIKFDSGSNDKRIQIDYTKLECCD